MSYEHQMLMFIGHYFLLNAKINNNEIYLERTSDVWLSKAYTNYTVCEYTILADGVYVITSNERIKEAYQDVTFYCTLMQNGAVISESTQKMNNAYNTIIPLAGIFNCKKGDKIISTAQVNYVPGNYSGLAVGNLRIIKLPHS